MTDKKTAKSNVIKIESAKQFEEELSAAAIAGELALLFFWASETAVRALSRLASDCSPLGGRLAPSLRSNGPGLSCSRRSFAAPDLRVACTPGRHRSCQGAPDHPILQGGHLRSLQLVIALDSVVGPRQIDAEGVADVTEQYESVASVPTFIVVKVCALARDRLLSNHLLPDLRRTSCRLTFWKAQTPPR